MLLNDTLRARVARITFVFILVLFCLSAGCGKEKATKPKENQAPVACFDVNPEMGNTETVFEFDASCSHDDEDPVDLLRVRWDWESDGQFDTDWMLSKVATHRYTTTGTKRATLFVKDTYGLTDTTQFHVTVEIAKPQLILVPAGTFEMGDGEQCRTKRNVTLTRSYYLGKYEVTNQHYRDALQWAYDRGLVTVSGTSVLDNLGSEKVTLLRLPGYATWCRISFNNGIFSVRQGYEDCPVIAVSWYGAAAYCNWLSMIEGFTPAYDHETWRCNGGNPYAAEGYRLPTDAEWEYAARYDDGRLYPWGNEEPTCDRCNFNYCQREAVAVGSYQLGKSKLGFYDMAGNVEEYCNDFWQCGFGSSPVVDPCGPESGNERIRRGGCWTSSRELYMRSTSRYDIVPTSTVPYLGFRIARTAQ